MKRKLLAFTLIIIGSYTHAQVNDGLIAKYPFNGNAIDVIGGHDGIVWGATPTTDRFGFSNAAYHFNGDSTQYIDVPYHPDFTPGTDPVTISLWFHTTSNDTVRRIIIEWYRCGANPTCSSADAATYSIGLDDSSKVFYWVRDDNNNDTSYITSMAYNNEAWHHAVLVFDPVSDYRKYYINNLELDNVPFNMTSLTDGGLQIPLSIGRRFRTGWDTPGLYFSGKIDDIRFYNRALSVIEIDSLYHEGGFVGISPIESRFDISVFPNPTDGMIRIQNGSESIIQFTLFNAVGEEIYFKTVSFGTNIIDLSQFSSNIYYYRLSTDKKLLRTGKLIKQ